MINFLLLLVAQLIAYMVLMLVDEYAGGLVAIIVAAIALAIWLLSYVFEWIEPSKVSRAYYWAVLSAWLAPILALVAFTFLRGGVGWLN